MHRRFSFLHRGKESKAAMSCRTPRYNLTHAKEEKYAIAADCDKCGSDRFGFCAEFERMAAASVHTSDWSRRSRHVLVADGG